ncbi:hypothetical protein M0R45_027081 [Rubus argutus]|uniref:Uncharacterized protein n=1 Tax=Rubus argutus TaxID=59490 RepID=A0AAW1X169_RUBAR
MVPSSPSGRSDQRKANTNGKDLADSLQTSRTIDARAIQNPTREKPITSGFKDKAIEKRTCPGVSRKPSELRSQRCDQKFANLRTRDQIPMLIYVQGGEGSNTTSREIQSMPSNPASSVQKNLSWCIELRSGDLKHPQREPRHDTSIYLPSNAPLFSFAPLSGKEESSIICRENPKPFSTVASSIEKNSNHCIRFKMAKLVMSVNLRGTVDSCCNAACVNRVNMQQDECLIAL